MAFDIAKDEKPEFRIKPAHCVALLKTIYDLGYPHRRAMAQSVSVAHDINVIQELAAITGAMVLQIAQRSKKESEVSDVGSQS